MLPRKTLHARAAVSDEEFDDMDSESEPNMKLSHAFIIVLLLHVLAVGGLFFFNYLKEKQPERSARTVAPVVAPPIKEPVVATAIRKPVPSAPASRETGVTHVVVSGDTLTRIAAKYESSVEAIEKTNDMASAATLRVGQVLKIPAAATRTPTVAKIPIEVKPSLKAAPIPAPATTAKAVEDKAPPVAAKAVPPVPAKAALTTKTYTIEKGDNPYSIARKLKVSFNALMQANKITDPTKLQIGQKLIVP